MDIVRFLIIFGGMLVAGLTGWLLGRSDGIKNSVSTALSLLVYFCIKGKVKKEGDFEKAVKRGILEVKDFIEEFDEDDRVVVETILDIMKKA